MPGSAPIHNLINSAVWDRAGWKAAFFVHDKKNERPSCLGLAFQHGDVGRTLFDEWRKYLGPEDIYDELRVVIVEGDVPSQEPGYFVHISSNPEKSSRRHGTVEAPVTYVGSRIHRMNPSPNSPFLPQFKRDFGHHGRYLLIPGEFDSLAETVIPYFDAAIGKRHILFRQAAEVGPDDPDYPVFSWRPNARLRPH